MAIEESFKKEYKPASFLRRILALFYDTLLLTGIILGYLLIVTLMFGDTFESISEKIFGASEVLPPIEKAAKTTKSN